jgi:phage nucleotide-binding protein
MKILNTSNIHEKPSYICIYGCSGIGKTSCVRSLPHSETLILDAESGIASLHGTNIDVISLAKNNEGVFVSEDKRYERLMEFNSFLQQPSTLAKYKYVFIDSLTEIAQNIQKTMSQKFTGYAAWGEYTKAVIDLLKFYRDLGHYTVIFTALEGRIEDADGASFAYPDIGGKKAKEYVLPQFDEVFRMIADSDKNRMFVTRTTAKTQAKDRSGKLEELEVANLGDVLKKMRGEE